MGKLTCRLVMDKGPVTPSMRDRLIDAAEVVMRRTGPLGVRIDEVATEAGCSRATVYRYVADKDELVREVLIRQARALAKRLEPEVERLRDPADAIAEGILRTVEAFRDEWWFQALEEHGATAALAKIGGGPQAWTALAEPLVTGFLHRISAGGQLRDDITPEDATEWLTVVTNGLLTLDYSTGRPRDAQVQFLRQFVAYSLLKR